MALAELNFMSGGGNIPIKNYATGTIQRNPSVTAKATLGFKPTILICLDVTNKIICYYNKEINETKFIQAATGVAPDYVDFHSTGYLQSLENDGFTIEQGSSVVTLNYIAIELQDVTV